MNSSKYDKPGRGIIDAVLEDERRRKKFVEDALGPSFALSKKLEELSPSLKMVNDLNRSGLLRSLQDAIGDYNFAERLPALNSHDWLASIRETSSAMQQARILHGSLPAMDDQYWTNVAKAAAGLNSQIGAISKIFEQSAFQTRMIEVSDQISPSLTALNRAVKSVATVELLTLRASKDQNAKEREFLATRALEASEALEGFAEAESGEERAKFLADFISTLGAIFQRLKRNTLREFQDLGLISILMFGLTIISVANSLESESLEAIDQDVAEAKEQLDDLASSISEILALHGSAEEALLAGLPRATLSRPSNVRRRPSGNSSLIFRAPQNSNLAVVTREGRWTLVFFRDPLSGQLSQGWIYGDAVVDLSTKWANEK